ncbi:MAG: AAA family ATPase [Clostridiales bacterium]|nr:AAA family ATPase [Clostridiales bacterium]
MTNAITRVEIKDILVFKGKFEANFCPGVNVFIGGNGSGKTTLLKVLYGLGTKRLGSDTTAPGMTSYPVEVNKPVVVCGIDESERLAKTVYIPEKDLLSNAKGIPETAEFGKAEFSSFEIDIIKKARVLAAKPEQALFRKICKIIGGEPETDGQSFFMKRNDIAERIHFSFEASGYRKFGMLAMLIRNEQISEGTYLLWDEPENSLNPELVPVLVDILLELQRGGVQVFVATHSKMLANEFSISRNNGDDVKFFSLYKTAGGIINADTDARFDLLQPNKLTEAAVEQYEREIERGLGGNG